MRTTIIMARSRGPKTVAAVLGMVILTAGLGASQDRFEVKPANKYPAKQSQGDVIVAVKPLLTVTDGRIASHERVRTMSRALGRLEELAQEALSRPANGGSDGSSDHAASGADIAVLHLDNRSAADRLARVLAGAGSGGSVTVTEMSAVLGVHCGPGTVGVVVAPRA